MADVNGDGLLTYVEKDAYLISLAMRRLQEFMDEFPYADRNQSGSAPCSVSSRVFSISSKVCNQTDRKNSFPFPLTRITSSRVRGDRLRIPSPSCDISSLRSDPTRYSILLSSKHSFCILNRRVSLTRE